MRSKFSSLVFLASASLLSLAVKPALAADGRPVQFQYTCPTTTVTLPTCQTTYTIPAHKRLLIQNVSGSATPLNPNAAGAFPNGQASLTISTQLLSDLTPINNIIGPNYALTNSTTWFFNTLEVLYTDILPVVMNNGGPVYIQGVLISTD